MTQKKELKDFIHLYLGCEVIVDWISPEVTKYFAPLGAPPFAKVGHVVKSDPYVLAMFQQGMARFTPLLRPLSDMTEEEGAEIWKISTSHGDTHTLNAKKTAYLLSRHFDLFGLIEAGLAKDKTKNRK